MYVVQNSSFYLTFTIPQVITFKYFSRFFYNKIILLFIDLSITFLLWNMYI